ncbi:hypothetical protein EPO17_03395 [Patescibacteria group bacterium]|nr:MAG: hypothetical protein EPO17_03395 [Patescibacteria group bacterium]
MKNTSIFHNFIVNLISGKKSVFASYFMLFGLILTASPISAHAEFLDYVDPFGIFHSTSKGPLDYGLDIIDPFSVLHGQDPRYETRIQQTTPTLDATCYANPTSASTGQTVYWNASAFGGNGNYSYSWSGTDGLSGNSNTISRSYSSPGAKTASVTVTSGGQTVTRACGNGVAISDQGYQSPTGTTTIIYQPYPYPYPQYPTYPTYNYGPTGSALDASCYVNPTSAGVGDTVYWNASASGGTGNYSYYWTGTDGLGGQSNNITKSYYAPGDKFASVTVTSGSQTITRQCANSTTIYGGTGYSNNYPYNYYGNNYYNNYPTNNYGQNYYTTDTSLEVSCAPNTAVAGINQLITWTSHVYGGNGNYQYFWTGTDNLTSVQSTASKSYSTSGTKSGLLTVTSGGQTITRQCTSVVQVGDQTGGAVVSGGLRASCYADADSIAPGQTVTWSALAAGGNGNYSYSWTGSDALYGSGPSVSKAYSGTGSKYATVTVTSDGQTISAPCVNTIAVARTSTVATNTGTKTVAKNNTGLLSAAFFGIGNFPLILFLILLILILIGLIIYLLYYRDREDERNDRESVVITKKDESVEKHTVLVDNRSDVGNGNQYNGNGYHNGNGQNH